MEDLIRIAHNATGSRVLDVLFESPTVSFKATRRFVMSLIGHYHSLVDDRIGSRIGDRCWAFADPYLRVRVRCSV
jgi:nucleolar protein 9